MSDKTIIFMVIASISVIVFIWNGIKIESSCYSIPEKIKKQEDEPSIQPGEQCNCPYECWYEKYCKKGETNKK